MLFLKFLFFIYFLGTPTAREWQPSHFLHFFHHADPSLHDQCLEIFEATSRSKKKLIMPPSISISTPTSQIPLATPPNQTIDHSSALPFD
jgi:hypothetical protein